MSLYVYTSTFEYLPSFHLFHWVCTVEELHQLPSSLLILNNLKELQRHIMFHSQIQHCHPKWKKKQNWICKISYIIWFLQNSVSIEVFDAPNILLNVNTFHICKERQKRYTIESFIKSLDDCIREFIRTSKWTLRQWKMKLDNLQIVLLMMPPLFVL